MTALAEVARRRARVAELEQALRELVEAEDYEGPGRAARDEGALALARAALRDVPPVLPAIDLLRRLASGEGGRRTGDLMRRGWIRVEVTEAGRAALLELGEEPPR